MAACQPNSFHTRPVPLGAAMAVLSNLLLTPNPLPQLRDSHFAREHLSMLLWLYLAVAHIEGLSRVWSFSADGALLSLRAYREAA
jgi:hypothetical protein